MNAKRFLALFLLPALAASTAAAQAVRGADPCAEARRIAESPACLAGADDCGAVQRWRQVFGPPGIGPADPKLTGGPGSRFAGKEVRFEESEPLRAVLERLAAAAGLELFAEPRLTGDFRTEPGTLPLEQAWQRVLGTAGLLARFEGGRVLVVRSDRAQGGAPRAQRSTTLFNCPTH